MRKFYLALTLLVFSLCSFAQTEPNRIIVGEKGGNLKGFIIDRVDSIYFDTVEGRVAADVKFKDFTSGVTGDTVWLSVTKTAECQAFKITVLPTNTANQLTTDEAASAYFENIGGSLYWDNFTNAKMTGFDFGFKDDTDYTILTVGFDRYGVSCSMSKADFHTPAKPIVGSPDVKWTLDNIKTDELTMSFKPNSDVKGYSICLFKKGEVEQQFEQFGAMFGFANIGDMVKQWGLTSSSDYTYTWTGLTPSTDYEVCIQAWDINDTYAPLIKANATTSSMGGEGLAEMTITLGDFGGDANTGYYQYVIYTPNENVALHRDITIEKKAYDEQWGEDKVLEFLKEDNPDDPYWNQYGVDNAQWQSDPETSYIAFSIGKNSKGEWGPLAKLEYTTPKATISVNKGKGLGLNSRIVRSANDTGSVSDTFSMSKLSRLHGKGTLKLTESR